jgi:hypothetical protein
MTYRDLIKWFSNLLPPHEASIGTMEQHFAGRVPADFRDRLMRLKHAGVLSIVGNDDTRFNDERQAVYRFTGGDLQTALNLGGAAGIDLDE